MSGPRERTDATQRELVIATAASAVPMGAQEYQEQVAVRARRSLELIAPGEWTVSRQIARSLRSDLPGNIRLPMGALQRLGGSGRRALGRLAYPEGAIVHRMDLLLPPARREIITMHDTVAWRFPDEGSPARHVRDEIRAAAAVVCVSQNTAADVSELTGRDDLVVIHPGVDIRFWGARPLNEAQRASLGLPARYVLHAGGASLRKNLEGLAGAWSRLEGSLPGTSLVLAGPPHPRRNELFRGLNRVQMIGRVPAEFVPGLVAGAEAVVVPSLYEGFGLPVLEAMAAGTPVVVARTSSLVEVAGDAAVLVDPDAAALAEGIQATLAASFDRDAYRVRAAERARLFDWDAGVLRLAELWRDVAES